MECVNDFKSVVIREVKAVYFLGPGQFWVLGSPGSWVVLVIGSSSDDFRSLRGFWVLGNPGF